MVKLIIRKGIHAIGMPDFMKKKCAENLTFENPKYISAKRYGTWIGPNTPQFLKFYSYNEEMDALYVPRGYSFYLIRSLKENNIPYTIEDKTTILPKIDFKFKGTLRPYQEEAIRKAKRYPVGVIEAPTGGGKTVIGIALIAERKQPTIIVVHTKELLNQWIDVIWKFLNYNAGEIGGGKVIIKDITVGIIQSVQNRIEDLKDRYGLVIIDETHRAPSSMFTDVLSNFSARYYLGLSATAFRSDKLDNAIFAFLGPKICKVNNTELQDIGAVLKPQIIKVRTNFDYFHKGDYSSMISALAKDNERNMLIAETVRNDIRLNNSSTLIVSDRVQHCEAIQESLAALNLKSAVLVSGISSTDRKRIVDDMRSGREKILISTTSLIGEGFDLGSLESIFLATPLKYRGRVIQVVGRICRPKEGKLPKVFDFRDDNIKTLRYQGNSRDRVYKEQGW